MLPSRGLCWSSQAIGNGLRRVQPLSARQFSSSNSLRTNPLRSSKNLSSLRINGSFKASNSAVLIRNGAAMRFASTSVSTTPAPMPTSILHEGSASATSGTAESVEAASLDGLSDLTLSEWVPEIPVQIGYLKSLGLDFGWGPTSCVEWLFEHVHVFAGTPWWGTIALTAVIFRGIMFVPYIMAAENGTRMVVIAPITQPFQEKMKEAMKTGNNPLMMEVRADLQRINARAGIKMWKSFVPMIQAFAGYGTFVLLRAMSHLPVPGFEDGGILWFYNLTIPDPYMILPFATAGILFTVLRKGGELGVNVMKPEVLMAMTYGLPLLTVLVTFWLPASMQLTFFITGALSAIQTSLFRQTWFRRVAGMTPLPKNKGSGTPKKPTDSTTSIPAIQRIQPVGPLSTRELGQRFLTPKTAPLNNAVSKLQGMKPPRTGIKGLLSSQLKGIKNTISTIQMPGKGVYDLAKERMEQNKIKDEQKNRRDYETRRQKEVAEAEEKRLLEKRGGRKRRGRQ